MLCRDIKCSGGKAGREDTEREGTKTQGGQLRCHTCKKAPYLLPQPLLLPALFCPDVRAQAAGASPSSGAPAHTCRRGRSRLVQALSHNAQLGTAAAMCVRVCLREICQLGSRKDATSGEHG